MYCERDKGVPKGRLYNWEGTTAVGGQNLETRLIESLLVICLAVSSLSLIDAQKTVAVPIRASDQLAPPQYMGWLMDRPSCAPWRMEKGPVRGSCRGHVGEIDCAAASCLLGLGPGADDRLGGYAGRGGGVVGLGHLTSEPPSWPLTESGLKNKLEFDDAQTPIDKTYSSE